MRLALLGFGNVGKAFARLLDARRSSYPFRIIGIHTRHGTCYGDKGISQEPNFDEPASSVDEFLHRARPEILLELTTLEPLTG